MSIPLEDFASQETVWDFDVSMVPGIPNLTLQNSAQFGALRNPRSQQQPNYGPTGILSGAQGGLIFWLNESKSRTETLQG